MNYGKNVNVKGFAAVIGGFSTLLDALRYSEVSDNMFDLCMETLRDQLPDKHFAYYRQDQLRFAVIFDTAKERDAYIRGMWNSFDFCAYKDVAEAKSSLTCRPISYNDFLRLADDEELNLNHYEIEDGLVIFDVTYGALD